MTTDIPWIEDLPLWLTAAAFVLVLALAVWLGYRSGLRQRRRKVAAGQATRADITLSSMLALLGLMLAFTYGFTLSRADARKSGIVEEANAIGTAFLKADFLPEPGRTELRQRLLDYARSRVITEDDVDHAAARGALMERVYAAQAPLWPTLDRALRGREIGPYEAAMMQALTDVLDALNRRNSAAFDRMPFVVTLLLLAIAALALGFAGSNAGLAGTINRGRMAAFVLILAALMLVILDFDRPQRGFIRLNNVPILGVVADMEQALRD